MAAPADIHSLDVILTASCNLRCSYCYQNDKKPRRMTWDTLKAGADLLLASRQPKVRMLFVGGEPLLEFPLIERAVAYIEAAPDPKPEIGYDLITNGTLLGERQTAFLAAHRFDVQLSFDGVPASQDLRGPGTFAVLDRLLDRVRADDPLFFSESIVIGVTVLARTLPSLADSVDYFLSKGVGRIALSAAVTHQPEWRPESIDELDRQFDRIFRSALRCYRRDGRVPLVLFRKTGDTTHHHPEGLSMCGVGRGENPAIDVDGQIHGCVMFAESYQTFPTRFLKSRLEAMRMGDVRSPDLAERMEAYPAHARAAGLFHNKQDKYSSYGTCRDCQYFSSCGVCPVSIGHQPGNTDPNRVPDFLCAYNLVTQKYRERFPAQPDARDILLGKAFIPDMTLELLAAAGMPAPTRPQQSPPRPVVPE